MHNDEGPDGSLGVETVSAVPIVTAKHGDQSETMVVCASQRARA
jgi:hypothetical protein